MSKPDILTFPNREPNKKYQLIMEVRANEKGEVHILADHLKCELHKMVIVDPDTDKPVVSYENRHL